MSLPLAQTQDVAWFRDDPAAAQPAATRLAERLGLGAHRAAEVGQAVSEAASNLAKHAVKGAIVLRSVQAGPLGGVEFLTIDGGPGMADVAERMLDGRSATGTLGIGLGTIARLADAFDLYSVPGRGTVVMARFWPRAAGAAGIAVPEPVAQGLTRPMSGAGDCGDAWAARLDGDAQVPFAPGAESAVLLMLCDGLGHGPLARIAAQAALRAFHASDSQSPQQVMREIHQGLAGTRGAAVIVARIEPDRQRVLTCGIGAISAAVVTATAKTTLPQRAGIAGQHLPPDHAEVHRLPAGSALILHSDGLSSRWSAARLGPVLPHTLAVVAAHLLQQAGKYHDDASVVVAKGHW